MVDGVKTHIIAPDKFNAFKSDEELIEELGWTGELKERFLNQVIIDIEENKDIDLSLGIVFTGYSKPYQYWLSYCLKKDGKYYHVTFKREWICRYCYTSAGRAVIPPEEWGFISHKLPYSYLPSDIFKRYKCLKCGEFLQNNIMLLDRK